tara:strand:+ start:14319 stop:16226 length:1908 start_codon:yes stop_codon:yes gene_type:complete
MFNTKKEKQESKKPEEVKKSLTLKQRKNKIHYISSVDEIEPDFTIAKEYTDKKNENEDFYIPKDQQNKLIVIKYDRGSDSNIVKQAFIIAKDNMVSEQFQTIAPQIKKELTANNYDVSIRKIPEEEKKLFEYIKTNGLGIDEEMSEEDNEVKAKVDEILEYAVRQGISDIHFEVDENQAKIRVRKNGDLVNYGKSLLYEQGRSYARIIYQVYTARKGGKGDSTFDESKTQDGVFEVNIDNKRIRVRVATFPAHPQGFNMVCRILIDDKNAKAVDPKDLGYQVKELRDIERMNGRSDGCIIIAGVTGSGKSTTLKALIEKKVIEREYKIKVITVEDPPEYTIRGCSQMPISRSGSDGDDGKKAYLDAMKAAVRSDPDVIMIGEIRDTLTADTLRSATESGHLVFATIHASSTFNIMSRLRNFELEDEVLTAPKFISGFIYQKLIKKLCPYCSVTLNNGRIPLQNNFKDIILENIDELSNQDINLQLIDNLEKDVKEISKSGNLVRLLQDKGYINSKEARRLMSIYKEVNNEEKSNDLLYRLNKTCDNSDLNNLRFKGKGCESCSGSGYSGRMVCAETLVPDKKILEIIRNGDLASAETYWRQDLNGRTAFEDGFDKMKKGLVDPFDVESTLGEIGA